MRTVILLALVILLAGCADSSDGGSDAGTSSSSSLTSTGPPPKPVVLSDTLHLLAPPAMALLLPDGSSESRTPTGTGFGGPGGGGDGNEPAAQWTYKVTAGSNVTGATAHIWIEIRDTLVQPIDPRDQPCTWALVLALGGDADPVVGCKTEPPGPISAGTKELVFDLVGLDAEMELNETITLTFRRSAFGASPEDSVFLLSGSMEHDSRIVLKGLKEPVREG